MLHGHPLTTQNKSVDENAKLYFFVQRDSEIASAVFADPQVCVTYADPGADSYVSVSGEARIEDNQARKSALFSDMAKAWFLRADSVTWVRYLLDKKRVAGPRSRTAPAAICRTMPAMAQGKHISASIGADTLHSIRHIGAAARQARVSAGDGQAAAATRLGLHVQTIARIESGEPGVAIGHVLGLLALYGIQATLLPPADSMSGPIPFHHQETP